MRYHIERPVLQSRVFGEVYSCNHKVYDSGTLFLCEDKGLVIIQQYIDEKKRTFWGPVEPYLANLIYIQAGFKDLFQRYSGECVDGLYPTISIRHALHWLKLKPPKKEPWETCFDRILI